MIEVSASFVHNTLSIAEYYIFLGAAAGSDKKTSLLCTQALRFGSDGYSGERCNLFFSEYTDVQWMKG